MIKLDELLKDRQIIGISGHVKPDGDCTGSCLAVYNYICDHYPRAEVHLFLEPIPNIFKFLKNADKINSGYDWDLSRQFDLYIALDCGDLGRLGKAAPYFEAAAHTLCIDHHISNVSFAQVNYIKPDASSTCELIYDLIGEENVTKEIAECIYVGIIHDTGVFQYSCTSAKTMGIAGRLMESGIDFPEIVDRTFYTKTYEQNRILGLALIKAKLHLDGKVISSIITKEEMDEYGVLPKHLDGIVSQLRVTKSVETAVFLYCDSEDSWKVSMRSNGAVDVAEIAVANGGGGHVRAAGATLQGEPEKILSSILRQIGDRYDRRDH